MKRIIFYNQKGGVGKSTLTYNLIKYLLDQEKEVYYQDLDDQGTLTTFIQDSPYQFLKKAIPYNNQSLSSSSYLVCDYPGMINQKVLKEITSSSKNTLVVVPVVFKKAELAVLNKISPYFKSNWIVIENKVLKSNAPENTKELLSQALKIRVLKNSMKTSAILEEPETKNQLALFLRLARFRKLVQPSFKELLSLLT